MKYLSTQSITVLPRTIIECNGTYLRGAAASRTLVLHLGSNRIEIRVLAYTMPFGGTLGDQDPLYIIQLGLISTKFHPQLTENEDLRKSIQSDDITQRKQMH